MIVNEIEAAGCVPKLVNSVSLHPISSSASNHERHQHFDVGRAVAVRGRPRGAPARVGKRTLGSAGAGTFVRQAELTPGLLASQPAVLAISRARGKSTLKPPFSAKGGLMEMSSHESGGV